MKVFRTLCLALATLIPVAAMSQAYPSKPVKIIVPYAAGGTGDILARLVAQELTKQTGQSFVVDNRTGAGGLIGYGAGAKSAGDGYTLVAMDSSYTMFPGLFGERVDWNIETDLVPISMYARAAFALAVLRAFSIPPSVISLIDFLRVGGAFDGFPVGRILAVLRRIPRGYVLDDLRRRPPIPGPLGTPMGGRGAVIVLTLTDLSSPLNAGSVASFMIRSPPPPRTLFTLYFVGSGAIACLLIENG